MFLSADSSNLGIFAAAVSSPPLSFASWWCLQVPTALLLERPLVMSSVLLDAYPCLRKSRVHGMVGAPRQRLLSSLAA